MLSKNTLSQNTGMKNITLFTLGIVCAFVSCRNDQAFYDLMDRAEAFVETNPDSAYTLLKDVELPENLNNQLFARWCMLYSQAADKLFKPMPYVMQLNQALDWYKKQGTAEQQAWIGLYLGRSYAEDKLFVPAINAYSDALELAKKKRLYNVAGYICSYMADLYIYTGQTTEELRKYKEAADFFKKAGNMRSYAFALRDVAKAWAFDDSLSIALDLMLKADSIITERNDSAGMASIANGLGNIYEMMGEINMAKRNYFKELTYDTTDMDPTYLALSTLYYKNNMLDSARHYLKKSDHPTDNPYTFIGRLYASYLTEKKAGDIPKALHYLEQGYAAKDSLYDEQMQVDIIDAEKRHNLSTVIKENKKLQVDIHRLFTIALFACLIIAFFYQARDRRRLGKINAQQSLLDEKEHLLVALANEIDKKETEWEKNGHKEAEYEDVKLIQDKILLFKKEVISLKCEKLQHSPLFKKIKNQCLNGSLQDRQALSRKDWDSFIALIHSACPNISTFMQNNSLNLTKAEIEICYLSFLGLGLNEEAILLGINMESVNKRRLRTRQKLNLVNTKTSINEFLIHHIAQ